MVLNELGRIVSKYWYEIPNHFPFVILDKMMVMPNHFHGILIINREPIVETPKLGVSTETNNRVEQTPNLGVSTGNHNPEWKPGTIGVIINQFKRICTIKSREILPNFAWQSRFHDRIIRNEPELNRIRDYILQNPANWDTDRNNQGDW